MCSTADHASGRCLGGTCAPPPGEVPLPIDVDGTVVDASLGLDGRWMVELQCNRDDGECSYESTPPPGPLTNDGPLCVRGTTADPRDGYGPRAAFYPSDPDPEATLETWDAELPGVVGVAFDIEMLDGSEMSLGVVDQFNYFIYRIEASGHHRVFWDELDNPNNSAVLARDSLVWFNFSHIIDAAVPFDFCISNFAAIVEPVATSAQ